MKKILIPMLVAMALLTACVIDPNGRYDRSPSRVIIAPRLPAVVWFDTEPYYYYSDYHYHYANDRWYYAKSRNGSWLELPRDRYPKEVRYRGRDDRQTRSHDHDQRDTYKKAKNEQQQNHKGHDSGKADYNRGDDGRRQPYFNNHHQNVLRNYFTEEHRSGKCPPGLAKKKNGCQPPGKAKKWAIGKPLQRDVIYYDLPKSVIVQLGTPPPHHRFVRVASDILLIAVGTGIVIDAIQDLSEIY